MFTVLEDGRTEILINGIRHRQVIDFPDYFVNELGEVFSTKRKRRKRKNCFWVKMGLGRKRKYRYPRFTLTNSEGSKLFHLHTLVLETFIGPCPLGLCGLHADDVPSNNRLDNLYYGTMTENMKDRERNGKTSKGEHRPASKLTQEDIIKIRRLHELGMYSQREIADMFNVHQTKISQIVLGKSWNHVK
jgi:predicted XRE-type DNA-binding protein